MSGRYREFPFNPLPPHTHTQSPLSLTPYISVVYLLQLINQYYTLLLKSINYIRVHSLCSVGFDIFIMICIHHYSTIQNSFSALKTSCALAIHSSLLLESPGNHWFFFYCLHSFVNFKKSSLFLETFLPETSFSASTYVVVF